MARVPGLTPTQREGQNVTRPIRGRAQAPDASSLKPAQLSPQAQPVDTYARPERPPETNSLLQLAESLGAINPALMRFTEAMQPKLEDTAAAARAYLQQTPHTEVMAALKSGKAPEPLMKLEGMRVLGEDLAYRDAQAFIEKYNSPDFDKSTGDVDELWRDVSGGTYEKFGKDRAFMDVYTKAADDARRKVMSANMDYKSEEAATQRADMNFGAWEGRVQFMSDDGKTGDEIAASLFGDIEKNKQFLALHPKDQQKQIMQIADRYATRGQFDVAKSIISYQRQNGAYKGSLLSDRDLGGQATDLLARIQKDEMQAGLEANAKASEEAAYTGAMQASNQGLVNSITDVTVKDKQGEDKVITSDNLRKEVARRTVAGIASEVSQRVKPEDKELASTLARKLEKERFIGNGLEHPQWFQTLKNASGQLGLNAVTGQIPPNALDAYQLYKELNAEAPQYLGKYLDEKSIQMFDAARIVEEAGIVGSPEDALLSAQRTTRNINEQPEAIKLKYEDIDQAVAAAGDDGTFWDSEFDNKSQVKDEIVATAKVLARGGVDTPDALIKAQEVWKKTHINVAGTWMKNDKRLPSDFKTLSEQFLQEFADKHGEELGIDVDDLTLDRNGNGTGSWIVLQKGIRQPLHVPNSDRIITMKTIDELRSRNRAKVSEEVITKQNNR